MSKKHGLIMVACCVIAMGALAAVFLLKVPVNNVFIVLMILICPLSHFFMMGLMRHGEHDHHQTNNQSAIPSPSELGKE
ncbi:MAG: hypothetical protein C0410_03325 [Anaerolinea sp.]|nr:hypothetical protein [Anaerolinea sp.]